MAKLLLLLTLLTLSATILSLAENINTDCGALRFYVNSDRNITLVTDKDSVTTGKSNTIQCLRYGNLNCYYSIPAIRRGKSLVRTSFHTENNDGKSSPPSFNVVYDLKHLDSVVGVSNDDKNGSLFFSEVIFAPANESISVCLIRTSPSDNPFISSIQVYGLDDGMYDDLGPDEGLIMERRFAFGAKEIIRYPTDPYGRFWVPSRSDDPTGKLKKSGQPIDITGASNKPPEIVMSTAISAKRLHFNLSFLPETGLPVYLALYFSEPQSLGRNQRRSFNVFLDETQLGSGPIVPVFGKATQVVERDIVATSESKVVFQSTGDSELPPIINAMELFFLTNKRVLHIKKKLLQIL